MAAKAKKAAKAKEINFQFAILGQLPARKAATSGVTIRALREKYMLNDLTIKANGAQVSDDYKIQDGDKVVVLTAVKGG